ncbi:MAG TPA: gamma-glutamyl-gamma-aminobutyrate hydrolase family protein [Thermoanaerobaculia bacterium]|nr:gamma-glutamyl-gamma-aminobutyrate hydrolase family protein [Thermoanaerobaculia bacterium]
MSGGWILVSTSTDEYSAPYVAALRAIGVPEERIRVVGPHSETPIGELAAHAKGLVLCGGLDVAPERYGEEALPHARVEPIPERDELEWSLLDAARDANVPVWGVCRGLQVLNVYLGGTLWQDLPTQVPSQVDHTVADTPDVLAHTVRVLDPEAPLGERLARDVPMVNSRHHQAVKRLADGLVPVALSPDGLVEAAFLDGDGWWVRGVQWHPENLIALAQQRSLWADFVRAAGFEASEA